MESSRVTKSDAKIKKAKKAEEEEKPGGEPTTSTDAGGASPMSFIKSMTGGGAKSSGSRDCSRSVDYFSARISLKLIRFHVIRSRADSKEARHSILDNLLRRGRSLSASRNSSRQSSVERAGSETGGYKGRSESSQGGSDAGDGVDNVGSEYSGASDTSFFKRMGKKKRPPVQPIDFDELFAR